MGVTVSNHESNNEAAETAKLHAIMRAQKATNRVLDDIMRERDRQDAKWGGPEHDDEHWEEHWQSFIEERLNTKEFPMHPSYRQEMVEVAALAIAALESFDRKSRTP
jgi:ribosomal protein L11 methylase PrmA